MRSTSLSSTDRVRPLESPGWSHCEARIRDFELAWQQGAAPQIEDFLKTDNELRMALLTELVHIDLEFRLKGAESVRVEKYLDAYPELADERDGILDLIATEFELLARSGQQSLIEEYATRFPDFARDVHERLRSSAASNAPRSLLDAPWPEVPGFEILGQLGRGGMGVVYKALESSLRRYVALKFLPVEFSQDTERLHRFRREARTASGLNHPHICTVHALDEHEGRPFIVMEFIEGHTLRELTSRRPNLREATTFIRQVAQALEAAHAAAIIHRDIKPENVMVREDGYVKVLDFGLARRLPTLDPDKASHVRSDTEPGGLMGTVAYMSPEQTQGRPVDASSDVFSLGIILYQLVTGKHPFECDSALATMQAIANQQPIRPSLLNREVSSALDGLIEAMLNKDARLRPTAVDVQAALAGLSERNGAAVSRPAAGGAIVHRQQELAALRTAFESAAAGHGSIICIAGEPGIGKTTLAEDFLSELSAARFSPWIAAGNCSERLSASEAYMPVFDALDQLLRRDDSGTAARLLEMAAPDWRRQLAWNAASATATSSDASAYSQQTMLREFTGLVQELSRLKPFVLFLDDVHWADTSTVDLLAHLGHRCAGMRVLVVLTYRPTEMLLGPHPFHRLKLELQGKGVCRDLFLDFLSRSDIDTYLALAIPGHELPSKFADAIHAQTEGSPLFVADLVRYLRERGVIAEIDGHWRLVRELPDVRQGLPESVRSMIERKLDCVSESDRRLLAAASIYGREFDGAILCRALKCDVAELEEQLQSLDRIHRLVRLVREVELPDKTLTVRYAFVHVLYQQALASELPPARRAALATAIAESLEACYGAARAGDLAYLYKVGREFWRSGRQYCFAAQNAACIFAHREAASLARRGLQILDSVAESPERAALELSLQTTLGLQLQVTEGYAAPAAGAAYEQARRLCKRSGSLEQRFPVLWGLWLFHKVRSDLPKATEMAAELFDLARQLNSPDFALQAHQAMGITAFCRGEQVAALKHVEHVAMLYDPARHRAHSFQFGQDPGVICKAFGAVSLWLLGFPDAARRQSEQAIEMSQGLSANSRAVALHFAAMVYQLCGDIENTRRCAGASIAISAEHGFSFWLAGGHVFCGWAEAAAGSFETGIARLRRGLSDWDATGSVTYRTYYLGLLAEKLAAQNQPDESRSLLNEALSLVRQTHEGLYEPELHRLRAEVTLQRPGELPHDAAAHAADDYQQALAISGRQETKSLELRAAISRVHQAREAEQRRDAYVLLDQTYRWFTQGLDTHDLRTARTLLAGSE